MKKLLALMLALMLILSVCPLIAGAEENVTIRFAWWGDATRHEATLKAVSLFEEKYPSIHVEPEYGGWDGYVDKELTQVAGGTAADVIQDGGVFSYLIQQGASFVDLYDYLDVLSLDNFSEAFLEAYCVSDGKLVSMPTGLQAYTTLQNTSLLEQNGVVVPERWTWDSLIEAAKQLHESDPSAYLINASLETIGYWLLPMYVQQYAGGVVITDDYQIDYPEEALLSFFTWVEGMYAANGFQNRSEALLYDGSPLENPKWAEGKLGISLISSASYTWYVFNDYLAEHIEVVPCFSFPEGEADNDGIIVPPASYYLVPASSKHPKEAAMLIDFLLNDLDAGRAQGTVRSLPANSEVLAVLQAEDLVNPAIARAVEIGAPRAAVRRGSGWGNNEITNLMYEYIEQIGYGKITAGDAATACYAELEELCDELR